MSPHRTVPVNHTYNQRKDIMSLTYDQLVDAFKDRKVGIRATTSLAPLGGKDDKIFPPTYSSGGGAAYATEKRRVDGETRESVVLDAVASQSNRQELALLELKNDGAPIPVVMVDFSGSTLPDLDRVTTLEASHRVFDALFRDSYNGDLLFRLSDEGRAVTEAASKNAAALLKLSPTTLLFGGWDSTGPKGGLGAKYERAITSEIVAIGIEDGSKTSSRIDLLGIQKSAGPIYKAADPDEVWTLDPDQAATEKGKPVALGKGSDSGRPSQINHGNIVPSIDTRTGGVTADEIRATSVLSFAQLRRLRFPTTASGEPVAAEIRKQAETAAHSALAALGLLAITAGIEQGCDLRSRCVLVAEAPTRFELVGRTLDDVVEFSMTTEDALSLLEQAVDALRAAGLAWSDDDLVLQPSPKLVELISRSREVITAQGIDESDS